MPSAADIDAKNDLNRLLSRGELRLVARMHMAVVVFYLVDAFLLTLFGLLHTVPGSLGWHYGLIGLSFAAVQTWLFRSGPRQRRSLDRNNMSMSAGACLVMLMTALNFPAIGALMLMSMMAVLAASALQVTRGQLLALFLVFAGGAAGVLVMAQAPLQLPMHAPLQRALSAVWFAWLLAKCAATNVAGTQIRQLVSQANAQLAAALKKVEKVASTDDLTVLPNRRSIITNLNGALESLPERGFVGVAIFDIDHFKTVNDRHGHAVGDEVLRVFSGIVTASLRPSDTVGRYGGEEFLLVLRQVRDADAARDATERMRKAVEGHDWGRVADGLALTTSAGVALIGRNEDGHAAIRRADAALYAAKTEGRNRVVLARDDAPLSQIERQTNAEADQEHPRQPLQPGGDRGVGAQPLGQAVGQQDHAEAVREGR